MKIDIVILSISSVLVMTAWAGRHQFHAVQSAHGRYYLTAILAIGAMMALVTVVRLVRRHNSDRPVSGRTIDSHPDDRRHHFRIMFDRSTRPVFVQKMTGPRSAPAFTCPVADLSETGIRLVCSDVYRDGQVVNGEIIFSSGRTAPINGVVARQSAGTTSLDLHCSIPPAVVMAEQREQIVSEKAKGPLPPGGSPAESQRANSRLPSHRPKGICRSMPTGTPRRR